MSDAHDPEREVELTSALVPFFVITNGRALPPDQMYEHTQLVNAHPDAAASARTLAPEEQAIVDLVTNRLMAVAEIAGRTHLPLGIVRILIAQLEESGLVHVRKPAPRADNKDRELLNAVLEGLKNIGA
jgi:hypothetical protein